MKRQLKIIGLAFLLLAFTLNGFFNSEIKICYGNALQDIITRPIAEEKSICLKQPLIGRDCEYMYGFNAYPGPEEIFRFPLDDPSEYETVCPDFSGIILGGSTYGCDDIWYTTGVNGILYGIDLPTCEQWCIGGGGVDILDLAYDPTNYKMYGSSDDDYLYKIDQYTGEQEQIGPFGDDVLYMVGMAFDEDGVLYGIDIGNDALWTIDTESGEATLVGSLGININYAQGMDFCRETDVLYLTAYVSTGQLYECDEDTGQCTLIGTIGSGIETVVPMIPNECTWNPKPPEVPTISGPDNGLINQKYNFTIVSSDPNWDNIYYYIDWGDNTSSGWVGPYVSGENVTINHSWSEKNLYEIKAKAKDIYDLTSDWSKPLTINITTLPPDAPSIDGPTSGKKGEYYNFTFNSVDPDGHEVFYYIKWGDGSYDDWDGPHPSGEDYIISHSFPFQKTFTIEAKARDTSFVESNWSYFDIKISRTKSVNNFWYYWFQECFPMLERLLSLII